MRNEEEQQPKNTLVPALRFPEFQDAGEWEERTLGEFISERNEIPIGDVPLFSLTIEDGVTAKTQRYERSFLVKNKEDAYKLTCPGDFAYNPMNLRFGAIARYSGIEKVALSKYYNIFYCNASVDSVFCEIYFRSNGMITHYNNVATGTLIEKRRVHFSDFIKIKIPFPSLPEQQKIADCLSSLDEWITAEGEKLEALKAHKKGLMQQLFPAQGETVPRLRFPEFQDAEEWEEKTLGEVGNFIGGGTPDTTNTEYWDGEIQWFTPTEVKEGEVSKSKRTITITGLQNSSAKLLPIGTILITTRATIGDVAIAQGECSTNQGFQSLVVHNTEINKFWYYWILHHKSELLHRASGSTFAEIGKNEITKIIALRPNKAEQRKIADCLSSLDELITAQAEQVALLKLHKKGLMQRLFPSEL